MLSSLYHFLFNHLRRSRRRSAYPRRAPAKRHSVSPQWVVLFIGLFCAVGLMAYWPQFVHAQATNLQQEEGQVIDDLVLPPAPSAPPVYDPAPAAPPPSEPDSAEESAAPVESAGSADPEDTASPGNTGDRRTARAPQTPISQYVLEFNRSPVVGNRLRLQGIFPETRLGFTRPQNWRIRQAKAILRFQHSPSLSAERSNLVIRVNDVSIGSVPLAQPDAQIAEATFSIPVDVLQDYNEISMLAEQHGDEECTNPSNPMLWTEILPDSKIVLDYQPQAVQLDFSRYPYPFFDDLGLDPDRLFYLQPKAITADWMTALSRFQVSAGRLVNFRSLDTQLVTNLEQVKKGDHLLVIGTPADQPVLSSLSLPFPLRNGQFLDGNQQPVPGDVGLLMLATAKNKDVPVLVATGNSWEGVLKAVQSLVQTPDRQLFTGQAVAVTQLTEVPSPEPRSWAGYLPNSDEFQLQDLTRPDGQPFQDITVHGTNAPVIEIPFRALPDDRLLRGSTMALRYSYSTQINRRNSAIEVMLDGVTIGSERLFEGGERSTFNVKLPPDLIKPDSVLGIHFILYPEQPAVCGLAADQQLWGTLYSDTQFQLERENSVRLPDLGLLKAGYPLTAPQDLSTTAVVMPDQPTAADVKTLLAFSERMGRISHADSVKLTVYQASTVPPAVQEGQNIVAIGSRERFPFPEVLEQPQQGLALNIDFLRRWHTAQAQTLPDREGVIKAVPSPWNENQMLFALTSQTDDGLADIQDLFDRDALFSKLQGDTVLISRNQTSPSQYDTSGYNLEFLQQARTRQVQNTTLMRRIILFLQDNWWLLLLATVILALLLYSLSQLFINRVAE